MNPSDNKITPENFAELLISIEKGKNPGSVVASVTAVSGTAAGQVFDVMFVKGGEPDNIISDLGLHQVSDESAIASAIDKVIAAHPKAVADYKAGQQKSFGFLVGQTMKELKGKGNPQIINQLLKKKLSE